MRACGSPCSFSTDPVQQIPYQTPSCISEHLCYNQGVIKSPLITLQMWICRVIDNRPLTADHRSISQLTIHVLRIPVILHFNNMELTLTDRIIPNNPGQVDNKTQTIACFRQAWRMSAPCSIGQLMLSIHLDRPGNDYRLTNNLPRFDPHLIC